MSDAIDYVNAVLEDEHRDRPAATRRGLIAGAGAALGAWGLLGVPDAVAQRRSRGPNTPENILNIAATAEVLATIVNTVGAERVGLDGVTKRNVQAAAAEELIHYRVLTSRDVGAKAVTTRIWVPEAVFASPQSLLTTLAVGDQIFVNAYLIGVTVFARGRTSAAPRLARYAAEFMAVEAVHRALALQSLGRLGNDRAFMRFAQREQAPGLPSTGQAGFYDIRDAVKQLQGAGFGFGAQGSLPGAFYEFADVSGRTLDVAEVNTRTPL